MCERLPCDIEMARTPPHFTEGGIDYDRPTLSKSRMSTAICARFAASATSVKSFKNASVEGVFGGAGCGGTILPLAKGDCCVEDMVDV